MSWETGNQVPRKKEFISNEDLLKKKGFLEEEQRNICYGFNYRRSIVSISTHGY
jgi:hypothetical protein